MFRHQEDNRHAGDSCLFGWEIQCVVKKSDILMAATDRYSNWHIVLLFSGTWVPDNNTVLDDVVAER